MLALRGIKWCKSLIYSVVRISLQTDRAAMLDEIVDYVKFLRLQVKVLLLDSLNLLLCCDSKF